MFGGTNSNIASISLASLDDSMINYKATNPKNQATMKEKLKRNKYISDRDRQNMKDLQEQKLIQDMQENPDQQVADIFKKV